MTARGRLRDLEQRLREAEATAAALRREKARLRARLRLAERVELVLPAPRGPTPLSTAGR